MTIKVS